MPEKGVQVVNRVTGECHLVDGEGRTYRVVFDLEAVEKTEIGCGRSALDLIQLNPSRPGLRDLAIMLMAGVEGYNRRNPGSGQKVINGNLAMRIIRDSGGVVRVIDPMLMSLSRAEGLGLFDDEEPEEQAGDAPPPPVPPPPS